MKASDLVFLGLSLCLRLPSTPIPMLPLLIPLLALAFSLLSQQRCLCLSLSRSLNKTCSTAPLGCQLLLGGIKTMSHLR